MLSSSPQESLARYAAHGDEAAFAALVRTHAPLVWGTAMRRLGDAQLAEEAAQNVFLTLARKSARLASRPGLSAWLHRAAVLEASVLARTRSRRERRLVRLSELTLPDAEETAPDSAAGPWLDEALNRLPAADRALLLGRYFEERSYEELGAAAGKSGEAAKKQTHRALEKVAAHLRRRGVTLPAAGLAAVAMTEFSPAAAVAAGPLTSLLSLTSGIPAASASSVSWFARILTVMSTAKVTLGAAAVLLLLLGAAAWQANTNSALRAQIHDRQSVLEKQPASAFTGAPATADNKPKSPPVPPLPDPLDGATMVRVHVAGQNSSLSEPVPPEWVSWIQERYGAADVAELSRLIAEAGKATCSEAVRQALLSELLAWLSKRDPELAVRESVRLRLPTPEIMHALASKNPAAAESLFKELLENGSLARTRAGGGDPVSVLFTGIGQALGERSTLPLEAPRDLIAFGERYLQSGHFSELLATAGYSGLAVSTNPGPFLEMAGRINDPEDRKNSFKALGYFYWMHQPNPLDPTRTEGSLMKDGVLHMRIHPHPDRPDIDSVPVPNVFADPLFPAEYRQEILRDVAKGAQGDRVWSALVTMEAQSPAGQRDENLAWLAESFADRRAQDLEEAPAVADPADQRTLDSTLAATARALAARESHALAQSIAGQIKDPALRNQTLGQTAPP